jgi:hypothetical protein
MRSIFNNIFFLYSWFNFVGAIQKIPLEEDQYGSEYYYHNGEEANEIEQVYDDYYMRFLSDSNSSLSEFIDNTRIDSYSKSDWIFIWCTIGLAPIVIGLTFFFMFTTVADDDEDEDGTNVQRRRLRKRRGRKKFRRNIEEFKESENEDSVVSSCYSKFEDTDVEQQHVTKYVDSSSHSDCNYDEQSLESYEKNVESNLLS